MIFIHFWWLMLVTCEHTTGMKEEPALKLWSLTHKNGDVGSKHPDLWRQWTPSMADVTEDLSSSSCTVCGPDPVKREWRTLNLLFKEPELHQKLLKASQLLIQAWNSEMYACRCEVNHHVCKEIKLSKYQNQSSFSIFQILPDPPGFVGVEAESLTAAGETL